MNIVFHGGRYKYAVSNEICVHSIRRTLYHNIDISLYVSGYVPPGISIYGNGQLLGRRRDFKGIQRRIEISK